MKPKNRRIKNKKYDSLGLGTLIGLVIPVVSLLIFYLFTRGTFEGLSNFVRNLVLKDIFLKVISLCAITNLVAFYIFLNTKKQNSAKGVIFATLIFTIIAILMKF